MRWLKTEKWWISEEIPEDDDWGLKSLCRWFDSASSCPPYSAHVPTHTVGIPKINREKEEDLATTSRAERGIAHPHSIDGLEACPTILLYAPILSVTGTKLLRTAIISVPTFS
jgi:hypothetical protein